MKTFVPTLTRKTTWNTPLGALSNRVALLQKRLYSLFQLRLSGFYFGIFAAVGAIQTKEAAIENKGHDLSVSNRIQIYLYKEYSK